MARFENKWALMLSLWVGILSGCSREELIIHEPGSSIKFSASGSWQTDYQTRTEYSGQQVDGYERIDWVVDADRIRILCSQASGGTAADGKASDYSITEISEVTNMAGQRTSQAGIKSVTPNGLQWGSLTDDHYFFALYPAPGTVSNYGLSANNTGAITANGASGAVISGNIPAVQEVSLVENTDGNGNVTEYDFKANMNYAYMYARTKVDRGGSGPVSLSFDPLVTALEFTLKAGDATIASRDFTAFKLVSSTTDLCGDFTAAIPATGTPSVNTDNAGQAITIPLPAGTHLSTDVPLKITVLALPVQQTDLTVELVFSGDQTRTLALTRGGSPLSVTAGRKMYLSNVAVPDDIWQDYTLEVTGPTASIDCAGGTVSYSVRSTKTTMGNTTSIPWTTEFSEDGGSTWSQTSPAWLTSYNTAVSGSSTEYTATASSNQASSLWGGGAWDRSNSTKANAIVLSQADIYGEGAYWSQASSNAVRTSNCYVVTKPGWYMFPAVYGNGYGNEQAMKNNNSNPYMLNTFLSHDGNPLNTSKGPGVYIWIQNNIGEAPPVTAEVLWQDKQELITTTGDNAVYSTRTNTPHSYGGRFICFYVDPNNIGEGNALIALKYNGTVVWSWHIWVIEKSKLSTTPVTNAAGNTVDMMTVNLGWVGPTYAQPRSVTVRVTQEASGKQAEFVIAQKSFSALGRSTLYQWGRKDPMKGADQTLAEPTFYPTNGWSKQNPSTGMTIAQSIQNPNVFYGTGHNWATRYDNLWNANDNTAYDTDVPVVKTIYDPCPKGFKVPNRDVFTGFEVISWELGKGFYFKRNASDLEGIYFPMSDLRDGSSGELRDDRTQSFYWTAGPVLHGPTITTAPRIGGRYLQFGYNSTTLLSSMSPLNDYAYATYGFTVRCIKE